MCGGSSGSNGETKYTWNEHLEPKWVGELDWAHQLKDRPYTPYEGQRIAGLNSTQTAALDKISGLANQGGTVFQNAGRDVGYRTLGGDYLGANPYSDRGNLFAGMKNPYSDQVNPMASARVGTERNQYQGTQNPWFLDKLSEGMAEIQDNYNQGTSAETTRLFNMAGAFGGSAHQNAMANNQNALGKQLGSFAHGMMNDQFNRSANLEEAHLGRDLAAQQYNMGTAGGWMENALNRGNQNYGDMINRLYQSGESQLGRGFGGWEGERARQMQALGLSQGDQSQALQLFNSQLGAGDVYRGYNQDLLNQSYSDWQDANNHPYKMVDWFTGLLSRAQGGMAPNSQVFGGQGYQASPFSQILGASMLGNSMFGKP